MSKMTEVEYAKECAKRIKLAKKLVAKYKTVSRGIRMEIAAHAIFVRDLGYKITVFADKIELNYQTLKSWMREAEKPIDAIIEAVGESNIIKPALNRAKKNLKPGDSLEVGLKEYNKQAVAMQDDIELEYDLSELEKLSFKICDQLQLHLMESDTLKGILLHSEKITKKLANYFNNPLLIQKAEKNITIQQ